MELIVASELVFVRSAGIAQDYRIVESRSWKKKGRNGAVAARKSRDALFGFIWNINLGV